METVKQNILSGLQDDEAKVSISKEMHHCHHEAIVISKKFEGLNRLQRHRCILNSVKEQFRSDLHALSIKAYTPEEWKSNG